MDQLIVYIITQQRDPSVERGRLRCFASAPIRAPSKSTKRLTLQSLRGFAVAWSTAGYAFAFRSRSFSPLSASPFLSRRRWRLWETPSRSYRARWQRVWISSALFHPRRTYFNGSRRRERVDWCLGTIPNTPRGGSIARSLRLGFHHFRERTWACQRTRREATGLRREV